jgi:hypothetical protein
MALSETQIKEIKRLKSEGHTLDEIKAHFGARKLNRQSPIDRKIIGEAEDQVRELEAGSRQVRTPFGDVTASEEREAPLGQRLAGTLLEQSEQVQEQIAGEGEFADQSSIRRGVGATASAFTAVPRLAGELLPEQARQAGAAGTEIVGKGFMALIDKISDIPALQQWTVENPEAAKVVEEVAGTASGLGQIAGTILTADAAARGLQTAADVSQAQLKKAGTLVDRPSHTAVQEGQSIREKIQTIAAKKNVDPQVQQSVKRLTAAADRVDDPLTTYNKYYEQSSKAVDDIKIDPAIAEVGSKIGDNFKQVIQQRREVGKIMGSELKKFANKPVSLKGQVSTFQDDLIQSGAKYDSLTGKVSLAPNSKFTQTDLRILQQYADDLNQLGTNPTAGQVDAFLSRVPNTVKELKQTRNINTMTNAERIVTKNLNEARTPLQKVATQDYLDARAAYSDLSGFIDEGSGFLGKVTQAGDFTKDASIAKSSVQSILNNGKKDWLIKLEELTGYNALDDSVLALQAMKDAGDFRGLSLLESINEGSVPLSQSGAMNQVLQFTLNKGAQAIVGDPVERTRAFLKSLTVAPK